MELELIVTEAQAGRMVKDAVKVLHLSGGLWKRIKWNGRVTVNGEEVHNARRRVAKGDRIVLTWSEENDIVPSDIPLSMNFDVQCQKVNGISPADVAEEPAFPLLFEEIRKRLEGQVVFAHNARFDMGVLASSIATYGLPDLHFCYGDTVPLSVKLWPDMENHKLNTVAEALGFDFHHHSVFLMKLKLHLMILMLEDMLIIFISLQSIHSLL